jgi:hypothetical protein
MHKGIIKLKPVTVVKEGQQVYYQGEIYQVLSQRAADWELKHLANGEISFFQMGYISELSIISFEFEMESFNTDGIWYIKPISVPLRENQWDYAITKGIFLSGREVYAEITTNGRGTARAVLPDVPNVEEFLDGYLETLPDNLAYNFYQGVRNAVRTYDSYLRAKGLI